MKTAKMNRKNTTVTANKYLVYPAYVSARELASAHDGTIDTTADNRFTAKFPTVEHAKAFVQAWTTAYENAREERIAYAQAQSKKYGSVFIPKVTIDDYATSPCIVDEPTPAPAPKRTRKAKGNGKAVDFTKIKGNTKSERNKAAHALIVSTGVKSGSDEYKALWDKWTSVR